MLEVEIKAEVKIKEMEKKIRDLGARFIKKELQKDTYFRHPCRDFKAKDEALRVRRVEGKYFLTYKGERQDPETKTRPEIETNWLVGSAKRKSPMPKLARIKIPPEVGMPFLS